MADEDQLQQEQEQTITQPPSYGPGEYLLIGLLFLITGALFLEALKLPGIFQGESNSSGTLPQTVTLIMLILLFIEGIKLFRRRGTLGNLKEAFAFLISKDVAILIIAVAAYAFLVELLHFELTTLLFLWGCMMFLDWRRPWQKLLVSISTVVLLVLVFYTIFHVVLP